MKMSCFDLILEITRRCNMKCCHCMRGDADDLDMSDRLIKNIFNGMSSVTVLTFSGGEPSIAADRMRAALEAAKWNKTFIQEVYVVTNGKEISRDFIQVCRDWNDYCLECSLPANIEDDAYAGGEDALRILKSARGSESERIGCFVSLSMDTYHEDIPVSNILKLAALPHVDLDHYRENAEGYNWVICDGRAAFNGIGDPEDAEKRWDRGPGARDLDLDRHHPDGIYTDKIYVNAEGSILKNCDYSYETQENYVLGHIENSEWPLALAAKYLEKED